MAAIHDQIKELDNRLLASATHGDVSALRGALLGGADKQATNANGQTMLHLAAQGGHIDALRYLCEEQGLDINARDKEGNTPLLTAYQSGKAAAADCLIELGADVNARDNRGFGVIWKVVKQDGQHVDEALLKHVLNHAEELNEYNVGGVAPLGGLVHQGDIKGLEVALLAGMDPKAKDNATATSAYEKALTGNIAMVIQIVEPFAKLPQMPDVDAITYDQLVAENADGKRLLDNPVIWRDMPKVLDALEQKGEPLPSKDDLLKGGMMGNPPMALAFFTGQRESAERCLASRGEVLEGNDFAMEDGSALNMFGKLACEQGILQSEFSLERAEKRGAEATRELYNALPKEGKDAIGNYYQLMMAMERNANPISRGR